jgi:hypothetical protein
VAAHREAFALPPALGEDDDALATALAAAADGDGDRAAATLADAFATACTDSNPVEREVDGRRVACHLYEPE